MPKRPHYALISMPTGEIARIPIDTEDAFDLEEAREFERAARHRGHTNLLDLLHNLKRQGLSRQQATGVVCQYLDLLDKGRGG